MSQAPRRAPVNAGGMDLPHQAPRRGPVNAGGMDLLDLGYILSAIRRRAYMILGLVFLGTAAAVLLVNQLTPLYRATTLVVIEGNRENIVDIDSVVEGIRPDFYTIETQAQVIASQAISERVVDNLNLLENPLFNPLLEPPEPSPIEKLTNLVYSALGMPVEDPEEVLERRRARTSDEELRDYVVDRFLSGVVAIPSDRAQVISISYASPNRRFTALAANAIAEEYIADQIQSKSTATVSANEWLTQRVEKVRGELLASEDRLERYRSDAGFLEVGGASVLNQQLAQLNGELIQARTTRSLAQAEFQQAQRAARAPDGLSSSSAVIGNPLIQSLRREEAILRRRIAELSTRVLEAHPDMVLARTELAELQSKLQTEINRIAETLRSELSVAISRENNIQRDIDRLNQQVDGQKASEFQLRSLESEVDANRDLYETLLGRLKETDIQEDTEQRADARILNRASAPNNPFYPRHRMLIGVAFVFSLFGALALALIAELFDRGFRSKTQLESVTGVPCIGMVPIVGKEYQRATTHPSLMAVEKPTSRFGEAIRGLRTALSVMRPERAPKTLLVTSSLPGEGKTTLCLSLARQSARSGQRVVLIDTDLRRSTLRGILGGDKNIGLAEYLSGQAELSDIIEFDDRSGMHLISAGSPVPNPPDLIGSAVMHRLIDRLSEIYDLVIIDSPPVIPVSDSRLLMSVVDCTLFAVRWEKTRRDVASAGLRICQETGAPLAGTVMTLVNTKRLAQYSYNDGGYHAYGKYSSYYHD